MHSLDVMGSFSALGVEVPLTASAAPAAIAALSERRAHYLGKRAEVCLGQAPFTCSSSLGLVGMRN